MNNLILVCFMSLHHELYEGGRCRISVRVSVTACVLQYICYAHTAAVWVKMFGT